MQEKLGKTVVKSHLSCTDFWTDFCHYICNNDSDIVIRLPLGQKSVQSTKGNL